MMMKWYFAYNQVTERRQFPLVQIALFTARQNTSLEPHCIISGSTSPCSEWLQSQGVRVHFRDSGILPQLNTYKTINRAYDLNAAKGAYLRLEIPAVETDDEYVLYTDTDVMFNSADGLDDIRPELFAMAPQMEKDNWAHPNSGVMVINIPTMRRYIEPLQGFVVENLPELGAHDQTALTLFFRDQWDRLPVEYNWKPYWGYSPDAKIIHWHGPKPEHVEALVRGEEAHPNPEIREIFDWAPDSYITYARMVKDMTARARLREGFDPRRYVSLYQDLTTAGVDGTEHYLNEGFYEKRRWR
jgi:hypothetical protein